MKASTTVYTVWTLFAGLTLAVGLAGLNGVLINHSTSMPLGVWRITPADRPLRCGDIVSFCPPDTEPFRMARERGYIHHGACPASYEPMLKPVVAVPGDVVEMTDAGVRVNSALLPGSAPVASDSKGRPLPRLRQKFVLGADELWMFSNHDPLSYDSRYFGPVNAAQLKGIAKPVWTTQ